MIIADVKLIRAINKLSPDYQDEIVLLSSSSELIIRETYCSQQKSVSIDIPHEEISHALSRLEGKEYIRIIRNSSPVVFSILPRMKHRFNYWLDEFTKRFWGGFAVGIVSSLIASYIFNILAG